VITLHGVPLSNYFTKVKLVLLEKGLPFREAATTFGANADAAVLAASPLGKIPYLTTPQGPLSESQVIVDWIEATYPNPPLLPADPYQAAKVREIGAFCELYLEWVARELYAEAFFGGKVDDTVKASARKRLDRNLPAFTRLARFAPYAAGAGFSQADAAVWASLPVVALATKAIYGEDLVAAHGIAWKAYAKLIGERPSAQKVNADRKAGSGGRGR
jgi:glutathione S-transferase